MNNKWFKSSVSMIMAALVVASGAAVLTTGAVETANVTADAASNPYQTNPYIEYFKVSQNRVGLGLCVGFESKEVNAFMHYGQYSEYKIVIEKDGKKVKEIEDVHCDPDKLVFYPEEAGWYTATLYVKDFYGQVLSPKSVSFEAYAEGDNISNFTASSSVMIHRVNSPIKFSADIDAQLYRDCYRFCYIRIYKNGNEVAKLNFNRTPYKQSYWTPTEAGSYTAKISVADWFDKSGEATMNFDVVDTHIKSFTASTSKARVGRDTVYFNAVLENASMRYGAYSKFDIIIKKDGKVVETISDQHADPANLKFYPKEAGKYTATLDVKDFYCYQLPTKTISFEAVAEGINITNFEANSSTVIKRVNSPIKFSANINARLYRNGYRFAYIRIYKDGEEIEKLDFNNTPYKVDTWTPTATGTYKAKLTVADWYDNSGEAEIEFKVVKSYVSSFKVTSTKDKTPESVVRGTALTFVSKEANAGMHYGQYSKYDIIIKKDGKQVAKLSDVHKDPANLVYTPTSAGNYTATLDIKDFYSFQLPKKTISFKVYNPLTSTFTLSTKSVKVGSSVKLTCTAKNGAGSNQYAFYYRKVGATSWTTIKGFNSTNTATFKPSAAGTYEVASKVKDADGTIVKKYDKVTVTKK